MSRLSSSYAPDVWDTGYRVAQSFTKTNFKSAVRADRTSCAGAGVISDAETKRKEPPTREQIKELKTVLQDFCINVSLPAFKSVMELEQFQRRVIRESLEPKPAATVPSTTEDMIRLVCVQWTRGEVTTAEVKQRTNIGRNTLYKLVEQYRAEGVIPVIT